VGGGTSWRRHNDVATTLLLLVQSCVVERVVWCMREWVVGLLLLLLQVVRWLVVHLLQLLLLLLVVMQLLLLVKFVPRRWCNDDLGSTTTHSATAHDQRWRMAGDCIRWSGGHITLELDANLRTGKAEVAAT